MARTVVGFARRRITLIATCAFVVSLCALGEVQAASGVTRPTASAARASDSHCDKPGRKVVNKKPFFGTSENDVIDGTGGDDIIFAGDGNDIVCGEGGNDIIYGGGAGDHLYGDRGNDQLFGQLLDDHLYGGPDNDLLVGGHGVDIMKGGGGNDWLRGGTNRDVYDGGGGSQDVASFLTATPNGNDNTGVTVDLGNGYAVGEGGPAPDPSMPHQKLERVVHIESVIGSAFDDTLIGNGTGMVDGGPGADECSGSWIGTPTNCGPAEGAAPFVTVENLDAQRRSEPRSRGAGRRWTRGRRVHDQPHCRRLPCRRANRNGGLHRLCVRARACARPRRPGAYVGRCRERCAQRREDPK